MIVSPSDEEAVRMAKQFVATIRNFDGGLDGFVIATEFMGKIAQKLKK